MNKNDLEKYVKRKEKITIPEVQSEFSLNYKEAKDLFSELESDGIIRLNDDLYYHYCAKLHSAKSNDLSSGSRSIRELSDKLKHLKETIDSMPSLYKNIVEFCVENRTVTISLLQRRFQIGYNKSAQIMDWLTEKHIVSSERTRFRQVLLDHEDYFAMYGEEEEEDDEEDEEREYDERRAYLEERRKELLRRMQAEMEEGDEDEEEFYDDDFDLSDLMLDFDDDEEDESEERDDHSGKTIYELLHSDENSQEKEKAENGISSLVNCLRKEAKSQGDIESEMPSHNLWDDEEDFESACMDLIEEIASSNKLMTRQKAIQESKDRLEKARKRKVNSSQIQVLQRVVFEFSIATDEEFQALMKSIFG